MLKLSASKTAAYRAEQLIAQNNCCALCEQHLDYSDAVLDHRHSDGRIRSVLHRFCNTFLGKIENNIARNKITPQQLTAILRNYETYVADVKELLHHTHRTPEQKAARTKKRAAARRKGKKK